MTFLTFSITSLLTGAAFEGGGGALYTNLFPIGLRFSPAEFSLDSAWAEGSGASSISCFKLFVCFNSLLFPLTSFQVSNESKGPGGTGAC